MTPFERLALFAACYAVAAAITAVAVFVSAGVALGAILGGTALLTVATFERTPRGDRAVGAAAVPPAAAVSTSIRQTPREEIAARAALHEDDDEL